jgi:hypothetical protein
VQPECLGFDVSLSGVYFQIMKKSPRNRVSRSENDPSFYSNITAIEIAIFNPILIPHTSMHKPATSVALLVGFGAYLRATKAT